MGKDKLEAATIIEWLEDKLDPKNPWYADSVRSQLTKPMIEDICKTFALLPTPMKLKALLSVIHLPRSRVQETALEELLRIGVADDEQSVAFLAEILQPFPSTGKLFTELENLENQENRKMVEKLGSDLSNEISLETDRNANELNLLPLECYYMDRTALGRILPEQEPMFHFRLKNKTKAQIHRECLMNNASLKGCAEKKPRYSADQFAGRIPGTDLMKLDFRTTDP